MKVPTKEDLSRTVTSLKFKLKKTSNPLVAVNPAPFEGGASSQNGNGNENDENDENENENLNLVRKGDYSSSTPLLRALSYIRGSSCPVCSEKAYLRERKQRRHPPIRGLNSTWVTSHMLAMNRPSNRLIEEYK